MVLPNVLMDSRVVSGLVIDMAGQDKLARTASLRTVSVTSVTDRDT